MPPAVIAGVGLAASGIGTAVAASSANKAAKQAAQTASDTSLAVAEKNNALTREIYGENKATLAPWQAMGLDATGGINAMLGLLPGGAGENMGFDAYKRSSAYDDRLGTGLDAVRGGYSGAGTLQSGAALKSLMEYGQEFASNERVNYTNSLMPRLNALEGIRNLGFNAAGAQTGVATNFAQTTAAQNQNAADTVANAALYRAANKTSPIGNALSMFGGGLLQYGMR